MRDPLLTKTHLLFFIILIEGYVVLACELLAIRLLVPFVGSGTEVVAIIISAVLMPLAIGYHYGGVAYTRAYFRHRSRGKAHISVRKILLKNILSAAFLLALGLSYPFLEMFFATLEAFGLRQRLLQTACYALIFLVLPVFKLAQTVPLISNYFGNRQLSEITGRMLFFSTTGSFLGSVFSTIVLMSYLGVHNTVMITLSLLMLLVPLLLRRLIAYEMLLVALVLGVTFMMNSPYSIKAFGIISNNAYNIIYIRDLPQEDARIMSINRSASSKLAKDPEKYFPYKKYIDRVFLKPIAKADPPKDILIIGAGGFTVGMEDDNNRYTYIDIDQDLLKVSEEHFLRRKLTPNKRFIPISARAFVHNDRQQYDLILLDAYTNKISIPAECTTREFLLDVKSRLKPGGIVIANMVSSPSFADIFTVRYDNTFASVFPHYTRQAVEDFDPWKARPDLKDSSNILYIYYDNAHANDTGVYTDDRNTYSLDRY